MKNSQGVIAYRTKKGMKYRTQVQVNKVKTVRSFNTKKEALAWKNKMQQRARDNKLLGKSILDGITFNDLFDEFLDAKCDRKAQTIKSYKNTFNCYLKDAVGRKQLYQLSIRDFDKVKALMVKCELSNSTINTVITLIKGLYNFAEKRGYTKNNIGRRLEKSKVQQRDFEYWKIEQIQAFFKTIPMDEHYFNFFKFAFLTGLRRGEIIGLRWSDIYLSEKRNYIELKGQIDQSGNRVTLKGNMARVIPLSKRAIKLLRFLKLESEILYKYRNKEILDKKADINMLMTDDLIFKTKRGKQINPNNISKEWKKLQIKYGIKKPIKFHAIRHSFATNLARSGMDIRKVQRLLGHTTVKVTEKYDHFDVNELFDSF